MSEERQLPIDSVTDDMVDRVEEPIIPIPFIYGDSICGIIVILPLRYCWS